MPSWAAGGCTRLAAASAGISMLWAAIAARDAARRADTRRQARAGADAPGLDRRSGSGGRRHEASAWLSSSFLAPRSRAEEERGLRATSAADGTIARRLSDRARGSRP